MRAIAIADAVVALINGPETLPEGEVRTLPDGTVAKRVFLPKVRREELEQMQVLVVATGAGAEATTRDMEEATVTVDVAVLQATTGEPKTLEILEVVEDIHALLKNKPIDGATLASVVADPILDMAHLDEMNQATAVLKLTYKDVG